MLKRRFRIPREGDTQETTAYDYVRRSWPTGTDDQVRQLFEAGEVQADGIVATRPDEPLAPETVVEIDASLDGKEVFAVPDADALLWGDEWVIVDKPIGLPGRITGDDPTDPIRFMADVLGIDRDGITPVWQMPTNAGGPWLLAHTPEVAGRIREAILTGGIQTTWVALARRPRPHGRWNTDDIDVQFATSRTRDEIAELQLTPSWKSADRSPSQLYTDLLDAADDAGFPVLGDARRGGYLVAGGIRLRLQALFGSDDFAHSWSAPRQWWPDEPTFAKPSPQPTTQEPIAGDYSVEQLRITRQGVERLASGHPWVLRNSVEDSIQSLPAGHPVALIGPQGPTDTFALIDGTGPVAARRFSHHRDQAARLGEELEIRLDEAIGRRAPFFAAMGETDVFRVVHGEADGLPGLFVDRIGPLWCVTTTARCARACRETICRALRPLDADAGLVEIEQLQTLPGAEESTPRFRVLEQPDSGEDLGNLVVRDGGLRFRTVVDEGIHIDMSPAFRDERRRAAHHGEPDSHWLDLRCRTGAFCASLVRAGVETTNVDPQGRYFSRLDTTFELNGLNDEMRRDIQTDIFEFLDETDEQFEGTLVDLSVLHHRPDSTTTGARQLLRDCFECLTRPGWLFVASPVYEEINLEELLESAAAEAGRSIVEVEPSTPPDDFPTLDNFPEGNPFEAIWVRG